jgi:hypothetical protein
MRKALKAAKLDEARRFHDLTHPGWRGSRPNL